MRALVCATTAFLVAGCSTSVNLYPVQGPLASQKPLPVIVGTADGIRAIPVISAGHCQMANDASANGHLSRPSSRP
jgi:hypothetical protein